MNGIIFIASLALICFILWGLAERFAPNRLARIKTKAMNVIMSLPAFGPYLADLLTQYNFGQYVDAKYMLAYGAALILLNIFAYDRTAKARDEGYYDGLK